PLKVVKNPAEETVFNLYTVTWSEWALLFGGVGIMTILYLYRGLLERIIIGKPAPDLEVRRNISL
ncbi:MAG TPA: hypothetical protein DCR24_06850, partial [Bacillus bacterium]|nr:hypothetical protein [Bacillus sp. (in: firmicutes)]